MDSGPVQVFPPGLLGFLQLKNMGRNPSQLPDTIQSVLEYRDWLFESRAELVAQTVDVGNGAVGFTPYTTTIVVPNEEYWYVAAYSVQVNTGLIATSTVGFAAAWRNLTGAINASFGVGVPQPLITGVAATRGAIAFTQQGFFLSPGSELGIRINANEVAAGNITYQGQAKIVRLPI